MTERVAYRLRELSPDTKFWDLDLLKGDWASEPFSDPLDAAREFIRLKGVGKLRIVRDVNGHPRALTYKERAAVGEFVSSNALREEKQAKKGRVAA